MKREKIQEIVDKLQSSFDQYFRLFLASYPLFSKKEYDFGSRELNCLGLKCQSYLSMLGPTAKARMNFIGFQQLFAFNNEVDWYNWKIWINQNQIDHTQYLSISVRIELELNRMRVFLQEDTWESYCSLREGENSVSYLHYKDFQPEEAESQENSNDGAGSFEDQPEINHPEKEFYSNIEHVEKQTSILANIATFVGRISGM